MKNNIYAVSMRIHKSKESIGFRMDILEADEEFNTAEKAKKFLYAYMLKIMKSYNITIDQIEITSINKL